MNNRVPQSIGWSALLILCAIIGWNFWLASARDSFMQPTRFHPQGYPHQDFVAYYTAGKSFGAGYNPYLDNGKLGLEFSDPSLKAPYSRFKYPPTFLPLWEQLSKLDYDLARSLWVVIYGSVYLLGFAAALRICPRDARPIFVGCAALLTITSDSILEHIRHGQVDMLIAGLIMLSFAAYCRGRRGWSAAMLTLGFLIKVNPVFFLIYYVLFRRDYGFMVRFGLFAGLGIVSSLLWVPVSLYSQFVTEVLPNAIASKPGFHNQSIIRFVADRELLPQAISLIGLGGFSCFAWWLGGRVRFAEPGSIPLIRQSLFLMTAVSILLFSGLAWHMTFCWTLLPASLLLAHMIAAMRAGPFPAARCIVTWVLVCTFLTNARLWNVPPFHSLGMIGGGGLLAVLAYFVLSRTSITQAGPTLDKPPPAPSK